MSAGGKAAEALFDDIAGFIQESRDLLDRGKVLELAGLDSRVRDLCDMVLRLSQDERIQHAARLQQLLGELKALGETLVEQRDMVAEEIRGIAQHKKANVAYRIIESIDADSKKDNKDS